MKIRFLSKMPKAGISGGRLLALMMAVSLRRCGEDVDFLTDEHPDMFGELTAYSDLKLQKVNLNNLSNQADRSVDIVVIIPHLKEIDLMGEFVRHAIECRAKIVLLNFESPNWYNSLSPVKRDPKEWAGWDLASEYSSYIASISMTGNQFAKEHYLTVPAGCVFDFFYPSINTLLADEVPTPAHKTNEIVFLSRYDQHKGFDLIESLNIPELAGYRVCMIIGNESGKAQQLEIWRDKLQKNGIGLDIHYSIDSRTKFEILKRASALLFTSKFEGFGYPPLEAAYCLTPVACSDLPVIREYGGDAFEYGEPDDITSMSSAIVRALAAPDKVRSAHNRLAGIAGIDPMGKTLQRQFHALF